MIVDIEGYDFKNEKEFQKEYCKELKHQGFWYFKLPDIGFILKPCDIIALKDGKFYAIELKIGRINTYERCYKKLRPNQIGSLYKIQSHGGISLVVGYDKKEEKTYEYDFVFLNLSNKEL